MRFRGGILLFRVPKDLWKQESRCSIKIWNRVPGLDLILIPGYLKKKPLEFSGFWKLLLVFRQHQSIFWWIPKICWSASNFTLLCRPWKIHVGKIHCGIIWKLLVKAFRKYIPSHGLRQSANVQRHRHSWPTKQATNGLTGIGSSDASKILMQQYMSDRTHVPWMCKHSFSLLHPSAAVQSRAPGCICGWVIR